MLIYQRYSLVTLQPLYNVGTTLTPTEIQRQNDRLCLQGIYIYIYPTSTVSRNNVGFMLASELDRRCIEVVM